MLKNKIILFFVEKNTSHIVNNKKKGDYTILFYWDSLKET